MIVFQIIDKEMKRKELICAFYERYDEDTRLLKSRQGQLEYTTTMYYIHKFLSEKAFVLEIGAGTGRYSLALAKEGYKVCALELVEQNLEILRNNSLNENNIKIFQGDALDLSRFPDNSFETTLLLGPMYHLYEKEDQLLALREAVRVTKPGGVILTSFLSIHAIIQDDYLQGNLIKGINENFTDNFRTKHFKEQIFTGFYIDEFEELFIDVPVERITTVATDGILELAEMTTHFSMSDEEFSVFADYHLHNCERREYLGSSSHLLHICRKLKEV